MNRPYPDEDFDDCVDRVSDEERQRQVDEGKRAASGSSAELLSLQDAYIEGQRAGHLGLSASLNPYQAGCLEHDEWERARACVVGAWLNGGLRRRHG